MTGGINGVGEEGALQGSPVFFAPWLLRVLRLAVLILLLASAWQVLHQLVGYEVARLRPTMEGLKLALEWDPENPDPHYQLGLMLRDRPEYFDPEGSRQSLQRAAELNPYFWPHWMDLARTHEIAGADTQAGEAYARAVEINPRASVYRWRFGNFLLRQGDLEGTLAQFVLAIELEPSQYLLPALSVLWKTGVEGDAILEIWPTDKVARLTLMRFLAFQENAPRDLLAREWTRLLVQSPGIREGNFYIRYLLERARFDEARTEWEALAGSGFDSEIWNGEFEREFTGGSLGWAFSEQVSQLDGTVRIQFDGTQNMDFKGFRQRVIVQPGAEYEFSFRARSEDITTERGFFFEISGKRKLLTTDEILGTTEWTDYHGRFRVQPNQHLLTVSLRRLPSRRIDSNLRGTLWLDSMKLRKISSGPG